jgi:hypothetical protein
MITEAMVLIMNRAQRRLKPKAAPIVRKCDPLAALRLISNVRPFEANELVEQHNVTRVALELLRSGYGTEADFDRVGMTLNIGLVRAESIDDALVDLMQRGQAAMVRMQARYKRGMNLAFDAPGLTDVLAAVDAYESISDASSAAQITQAVRTAYHRATSGNVLDIAWAYGVME